LPDAVQLVPYDLAWPLLDALEAERLCAALDGALVEHDGSTSAPDLTAKPFIDVVAGLEDERGLVASIPSLQWDEWEGMQEAVAAASRT